MNRQILGIKLFKCNFKSIVLFELSYKLLIALLLSPLFMLITSFSLKLANISYLSYDNIIPFLTNPTTIIIVLCICIGTIEFIMFEISALIGCYHASYFDVNISVMDMYRIGMTNVLKTLKPKNILILLFILLILPTVNMIQLSGYLANMKLPDFISNFIYNKRLLFILMGILIMAISFIAMRFVYTLYYFTIEDMNFIKACKRSLRLIYQSYIKTVIELIVWNIIAAIAVTVTLIFSIFIIYLFCKFFGIGVSFSVIILEGYRFILEILVILYMIFSLPIAFMFISAAYYLEKTDNAEIICTYEKPVCFAMQAKKFKSFFITIAIILFINNIYLVFCEPTTLAPSIELFMRTNITAHRGDSKNAPENTMAAFRAAVDNFADWIELDVQQTKDGVIVVMHDSNLNRTTGINKYIWSVNYDEIKDLDAGSWYDKSFCDERIPTLDEVLKFAKGKAKLNIELKPTGHEVNFEHAVINIIKENNFEDNCVVTSLRYDALERVKEIDKNIKTIYVTTVAYGSIAKLAAADGFSIEYSFATPKIINSIRNEKKDIYVWTVNSEKSLQSVLELGVDNIITDNPIKAKEMLYEKYAPDKLVEMLDKVIMTKHK